MNDCFSHSDAVMSGTLLLGQSYSLRMKAGRRVKPSMSYCQMGLVIQSVYVYCF